jgi:hypothetical protein
MTTSTRSPRELIAAALSVCIFGVLSFIPGAFGRAGDAYAQSYSGGPSGGGTSCAAGGAGSSQCSYEWSTPIGGSSCSVTCDSGYYACCNVESCKCIKK